MVLICKDLCWRVLDSAICIFIIAPLVVIYWRGSFQTLDVITHFPNVTEQNDSKVSAGVSFAVGVCGTVVVNLLQTTLHEKIHQHRSRAFEILAKRCYTYFYGWIIVHHWRGVWRLWDAFTGTRVQSNVICFAFGCFCLIVLKSFRNIIAPPLAIVSDFDDRHFAVKTRFRTKTSPSFLHLLDTVFSVAIPGSLVVCVWRGQWGILDHILELNGHLTLSLLLSCALGFSIIILLFLLQAPVSSLSAMIERSRLRLFKIPLEDAFYYVACFGAVNLWRGIWGLCDLYIMPENYMLSNLLCHLIGAFGTMILLHGNTVLVRDVQIDGEFRNGEGCQLSAKCLTIFDRKVRDLLSNSYVEKKQRIFFSRRERLERESYRFTKRK